MSETRSWILFGPNSGGIYRIELRGNRLLHLSDGDAASWARTDHDDESVIDFLAREGRPTSTPDPTLADAIREIRGLLDGPYRLGPCSAIRFDHGEPVELYGDLYCNDVGRGGHTCTFSCAGRVTYESDLARAEAVVGVPLVVGEWGCRGAGADPYGGESFAPLRRATPTSTTPTPMPTTLTLAPR